MGVGKVTMSSLGAGAGENCLPSEFPSGRFTQTRVVQQMGKVPTTAEDQRTHARSAHGTGAGAGAAWRSGEEGSSRIINQLVHRKRVPQKGSRQAWWGKERQVAAVAV